MSVTGAGDTSNTTRSGVRAADVVAMATLALSRTVNVCAVAAGAEVAIHDKITISPA
jgi:hypothetical protein